MGSIERLQSQMEKLVREIGALGPMRRGSLVERYLPCGRPGCHCGRSDSRGHGPKYSLTYKVKGRTKTEYVSPEQVPWVREQLQNHARFLELSKQLVETSEQIGRLRLEGEREGSKKNSGKRSRRKSSGKSTGS
jgi:hypothetical protein